MPAINYKFKFTFSSASISSVLLPAAQMRNTNPNFSLYRAFHSDSSCKIDHMQMTNCHSSTINIAVEAFFLWPHVCCLIQSPMLLIISPFYFKFRYNLANLNSKHSFPHHLSSQRVIFSPLPTSHCIILSNHPSWSPPGISFKSLHQIDLQGRKHHCYFGTWTSLPCSLSRLICFKK